MNPPPHKLTRDQIMAALRRLDELLHIKGVMGEVCIFGGAAMVLAFDARASTRDVDAIFVPKKELVTAAQQVAEEFAFASDWLNDGVKGFVSATGEVTSAGMPVFPNLRILRPTTEYLLAMKCLASRVADYDHEGDRRDVTTLVQLLGIKDTDSVCDLVTHYYKESLIPPKVRYFIEEIMLEINSTT
jgi:Nucleotidyltransferase of unknown function (DUF6036)